MPRTLIIGSNRGIGLELVRQLVGRGDAVVAACRTSSAALDAVDGVEVVTGVDVTEPRSLARLASELGPASIEVLFVVSGILRATTLQGLELDVVRQQLEVNAIGPLSAVAALRGCVVEGGRIGLVTSRMGSIDDNTSGGSYGYRMSKAALNMAGRSLAHDLAPRSIAVRLLHPGWVRTEMTGGTGLIDVDEAVRGLIARMDELDMERSGTFVHQDGTPLPW